LMAYRGLDRKYGFLIWLELSYCLFIEDTTKQLIPNLT